MKYFAAFTLVLLACTASASPLLFDIKPQTVNTTYEAPSSWQLNGAGQLFSWSQWSNEGVIFITPRQPLIMTETKCDLSAFKAEIGTIKIDNQYVKAVIFCDGYQSVVSHQLLTKGGIDHLIDRLITQMHVTIHGHRYSAKGFTRMYKRFQEEQRAQRDAL